MEWAGDDAAAGWAVNEPWEPRSGSLVTERNLVHEPLSKYLYQEYKCVTERFFFKKKVFGKVFAEWQRCKCSLSFSAILG